jgi:3-oxoacyl-[acyl-carrier-protein] synthase-1
VSDRSAVSISHLGLLCPIGLSARQVWAAVRAGIGRVTSTSVLDWRDEPIRMALLPEDEVEPLVAELEATSLTDRRRRMLRIAARALRPALLPLSAPPPLFLGLPEPHPAAAPAKPGRDREFLGALLAQARVPFDLTASQTFAQGRASALFALAAAIEALQRQTFPTVVVGGVDTFLDLGELMRLLGEGRLLGADVTDGFVPGEGAAFLVLSTAAAGADEPTPAVALRAAGTGVDPGHRYSQAPSKGEGLPAAFEAMRAKLQPPFVARTVFAGMNGESFDGKGWGVTRMRHAELFAPDARVFHPADCYGDAGAATGAILLALAATALRRGDREGPALVWASSDRGACACAGLEVLA